MIEINDVLKLHAKVLRQTGGADGVRDSEALQSAIHRPFQTFGGDDLYPSILEKAAALMESLIANHPFVDGNKRTGFMTGLAFMDANGFEMSASEDERYDFVIAIASGNLRYDQILDWLQANTRKF